MESLRLFIAAELPPGLRDVMAATQQALRRQAPPVRWVAPEAMHLTLHFLGTTPAAAAPAVGGALRAALAAAPAVRLRLAPAGAFPGLRRPSVIWLGIGDGSATLRTLHDRLRPPLAALGFELETRPFTPHLTLGRARRDADPAALERLGAALRALPPPPPDEWRIDHVTLFRSELRPGGPIYTPLDQATLA